MTLRRLCVKELDAAMEIIELMKVSVRNGRYRLAINQEADLLFVVGQSLTWINRLEFNQVKARRTAANNTSNSTGAPVRATKAQCIALLNAAKKNFQAAKQLVLNGRYEDAENVIAATITGRILRCINSLR
ncbi:hypothetical protein JZ785_19485 [Alicyclobacillus curvatus]|nr:hypothetical protein JZ785_19485 [Alicyclobacillus curvatus]